MPKRGASAGDDEPAPKRAKVAPCVPPLLSNRTCKDNPRWLAGHTAEVLDAAGGGADRVAHAFMLVLFEGGCEIGGPGGCERHKIKANKATLWSVSGYDAASVAPYDPARLFTELVAVEHQLLLNDSQPADLRDFNWNSRSTG